MAEVNEIMLADMDAWEAFARANSDALIEQYGSVDRALTHAMDGGLEIGGGAQPLFVVYFEECSDIRDYE